MPAVSIEPKSIAVVHQNYISPFSTIPPLSVTAYHSKLALVRYPRNATANWPFAASFNCAHISRTLLDRFAACGKVCIWPFVCGPNFFGASPRAHSHTHTLPGKLLNNPCCHFTTLGISFGQFAFGLDPLWMLTFTWAQRSSARWAYNFNAHCRK